MKTFAWNSEKSELLKDERGISFEEVVLNIQLGNEIDVFDHPNQERYPGKKSPLYWSKSMHISSHLLKMRKRSFWKLLFLAARPQNNILVVQMSKLNQEEKEILEAYGADKLKSIKSVNQEIKRHQAAAEATFKKDARINIRLSSRDLRALQARALKEGIPYQTLVSSVLHKFVDGQFVDKTANK